MTITVYIDRDDRLSTIVRLNALPAIYRDVVVAHAPPPTFRQRLPLDLLFAIGHDGLTDVRPSSPAARWTLARAWMCGFNIRHLVIYGAWRLTRHDLATLVAIAAGEPETDVALVLVSPRCIPLEATTRPINELFEHLAATANAPAPPVWRTRFMPLDPALPPLPAADMFSFLSESANVLPTTQMHDVALRYNEAVRKAGAVIRGSTQPAAAALASLAEAICDATSTNELIAGIRAVELAALRQALHLKLNLRSATICGALCMGSADACHRPWPLPEDPHPRLHAVAALIWASGHHEQPGWLLDVKLSDTNDDCSTIKGRHIPGHLRPPLRALGWLRRHEHPLGDPYLFSKRGGRPSLTSLRVDLDAQWPSVLAALTHPPARLIRALDRIATITPLENALPTGDTRLGPAPADLHTWRIEHSLDPWLREYTGIPVPGLDADPLAHHGRAFARARRRLTGLHEISVDDRTMLNATDHAQQLHSVLLRAGYAVDRLSLLRALQLTAAELQDAAVELDRRLRPTAQALIQTSDHHLELRTRCGPITRRAVQVIETRRAVEDGVSVHAARLLSQLLAVPNRKALTLSDIIREDMLPALDELTRRNLVDIRHGKWICPTDRLEAAVGTGVDRDVRVISTNYCD